MTATIQTSRTAALIMTAAACVATNLPETDQDLTRRAATCQYANTITNVDEAVDITDHGAMIEETLADVEEPGPGAMVEDDRWTTWSWVPGVGFVRG